MAKERKDKHFIKQPTYTGGPTAMKKFIGEQMKFPQEALDNDIEGTVVIKYTINHKGKVTDTKVIAGLGYGCDEEAKRLVRMLQFRVPKHRGVRVTYHKDLRIHFRKPKVKKIANKGSQEITYTLTPSKKVEPPKKGNSIQKPERGYSYNIVIS